MHVQYVYTASEWFSPPGAEKDVVLHLGITHTQAVPPVTQTRCSSPQHINTSNIDISEAPPTGSTLCFSNNKSANQEGAGSRKSYSIHERRPWRQEPNQEQCITLNARQTFRKVPPFSVSHHGGPSKERHTERWSVSTGSGSVFVSPLKEYLSNCRGKQASGLTTQFEQISHLTLTFVPDPHSNYSTNIIPTSTTPLLQLFLSRIFLYFVHQWPFS